ncbi:dnaJ homolog subfamily C member 25-like [Amphiura filiformis]|uniref:dnaJ homolog subfamily C member 25-like n=1 Tax=Amphiura filiformis TaxID=82378 RepID=UPI003B213ADD
MATKTYRRHVFLKILILSALPSLCTAFIEGLYCGKENCYDVLSVTRDSTRGEISKAYRSLARKYHPDKYKGKDAEEKFQAIATAYEILKDEEQREDYDDMLDNPDEYYRHYYQYYRRRVAPKVDVRIVIAVTITVISMIQYFSWWSRYNSAIKYLASMPKYRIKAIDLAKKEGLLQENKKKRGKTKEELKEEEENAIRTIIESNADIRGGYSKPKITDILWIQLVLSPWFLVQYILWHLRWIWKFIIKREEYGDDEKHYLIQRNLRVSQSQYDSIEAHERDEMFSKELWIRDKYVEYKKQKDEEMRIKLAESSKYRSYRRYMKNKGPGRMTFDED